MSEQEEINNLRNQAIDSALISNQKMFPGLRDPLKPFDIYCPKCGDNTTRAMAYFCKCGWEQMGNNHEAIEKHLASIEDQNNFIRKQLEILKAGSEGPIHIWASEMLEHMDKLK